MPFRLFVGNLLYVGRVSLYTGEILISSECINSKRLSISGTPGVLTI